MFSTKLAIGAFLTAILAAPSVTAQISVEISPNPAPIGTPIVVTITDSSTLGLSLRAACNWYRIHEGTQTGPIVGPGGFCLSIPVPVAPNGSFSYTWNQINTATGVQAAPGRYWVYTTNVTLVGAGLVNEWFCFDIQGPNEPSMTANSVMQVNTTTQFTISSPNNPNDLYGVLMSFDQTTPLVVPGLIDLCLSAPIFSLGAGALDATGVDTSFSFMIPNQPGLAYSGIHLQTIIVDPALNLVDTNALSLTIRP